MNYTPSRRIPSGPIQYTPAIGAVVSRVNSPGQSGSSGSLSNSISVHEAMGRIIS